MPEPVLRYSVRSKKSIIMITVQICVVGFTFRIGGDFMRRVVVDMQNALFADAIATALQKFDSDFEVCQSDRPDKTADLCVFT